jgi:hypothetical protein
MTVHFQDLLRRSGRAVCLYCTSQLTTIYLEDFFLTSSFPDFITNPLVDLFTTHYEDYLRIQLKTAMSSFSTDLLMNVSEKKGYVKVSYCMIKVLLT